MAKIEEIISEIDMLLDDTTIPKNIKKALNDARERLKGDEELNVKVSAAVYHLESVSEDINMPSHARMQIWTIMSSLESLKR
ncbi:UPF0147 family protein [Candidatus Micrarchaeota archaeon]|nr:UPF0147 family protein [Candidatus Micrarchaeota archaeon]